MLHLNVSQEDWRSFFLQISHKLRTPLTIPRIQNSGKHEQQIRIGKCLPAALRSNLFCIWRYNTTPLCSSTDALLRKTVNKTLQGRSLCTRSPTAEMHKDTGWIIYTVFCLGPFVSNPDAPFGVRRGHIRVQHTSKEKPFTSVSDDLKRRRSATYCLFKGM